ncbi:hypothetical protein CLV30_12351 [Haloactinopolyspora alba]|uniref:Uncharacterized protein n=1 Tax=Haloactinopolyspora alba TaxID=648780 RepID=A0A2P8DJ44_9ACTN|nr:DUF6406 domain-containing protein [Haloactinopolyspora alba]PSK97252.1 hypothetical protein CLV30_12351 [Haloactinopolyspora alba]
MASQQIRVRRRVPYWLDNATRDRALAVMSFDTDTGSVDLGYLAEGTNTVHTLGVGDRLDTAEASWRVTEIHPGDEGYVVLEPA